MSTPLCRHLGCTDLAAWQGVVITDLVHREVVYCDKHLAIVSEQIGKEPNITLTEVRPIERNQTMKPGTTLKYVKETRPMAAEPGALATVLTYDEAVALGFSLPSLEKAMKPGQALLRWEDGPLRGGQQHGTYPLDSFEEVLTPDSPTGSENTIAVQDKTIAGLKRSISDRDRTITSLKKDIEAADTAIGERGKRINERDAKIHSLEQTQQHLVSALHALGDNYDDACQVEEAQEIDNLLADLKLKPRKQAYTIEILVPTRLHLHVQARSLNHARTLYEAGDVDWNVADGEVQEDDIKVLDISEGSL